MVDRNAQHKIVDPQALDAFKYELKALLLKHKATLHEMLDGDTHGIWEEGIGVSFSLPKKEGHGYGFESDTYRLSDGYTLDVHDLSK